MADDLVTFSIGSMTLSHRGHYHVYACDIKDLWHEEKRYQVMGETKTAKTSRAPFCWFCDGRAGIGRYVIERYYSKLNFV